MGKWRRRLAEALVVGLLLLAVAHLRRAMHAAPAATRSAPAVSAQAPPEDPAPPEPRPRNRIVTPREYRMVLATIPRSGNGWLRGLIEAAIGVGTESVFPEGSAVYHNVTQAYGTPCGWLGDCAIVRAPRVGDPIIIKTHFPFTTLDNKKELLARGVSDCGPATFVVLPVRNPLDNFEAWMRYNMQRHGNRTEGVPATTVREFVTEWAAHHDFWFAQGTPCFVYRYEYLVDNPLAILVRVLRHSGLWARFQLSDADLLRVAAVPRLQAYRRKQLGSQSRSKDDIFNNYKKHTSADIAWTLATFRPILRRFGYDELYEAWQAAAAGKYNETTLQAHVKELMERTALTANWGETVQAMR